ncbi:MAG TPA: hypothetical protein VK524_05545 [Polyangiaceae bacterium]|nr:hypothetical protein [Polyangiaceae bacterium]
MRRALLIGFILILGCLAVLPCAAAPGGYLQDMPSVEAVREEFGGFTEVQAAGKQAAALKQLGMIIKELSAGGEFGNQMTDEERAVSERYFTAAGEVTLAAAANLAGGNAPTSGPKSPSGRMSLAMMRYDHQAFRQRVAQLMLPPVVAARYANLHPNTPPIGAIALLFGGLVALVLVVKLYFKLFPARPDDHEIVGYSTRASVVGGVGIGHTRPVTRRESKLWGRMLMFALLLAPLFAAGTALMVLVGPHFSVLQPLLGVADSAFYGMIDFFECWTL